MKYRVAWVEARDRQNGRVFLGGLGCLGVGQMWFDDDGSMYQGREGYDGAPERDSTGGFGTVALDE